MNENYPLEYTCPICFEIPQNEIYQCVNGHTICDQCSPTLVECPQCRTKFEGKMIRNRVLESLLDKTEFDCPFKQKGCVKKVYRKDIRLHENSCSFGTTGVKFCERLGFPCEFILNPNDVSESLTHLQTAHDFIISRNDEVKVRLHEITSTGKNQQYLCTPIIFDLRESKGLVWVLLHLLNNAKKTISPICIKIWTDSSKLLNGNPIARFAIHPIEKTQKPELSLSLPLVDIKHTNWLIQHPPVGINTNTLTSYYTKNDMLEIVCSSSMEGLRLIQKDIPIINTFNNVLDIPQQQSAVEPSAPPRQLMESSLPIKRGQGLGVQRGLVDLSHSFTLAGYSRSTNKPVVFDANCDVCNEALVNQRYKCLFCRDYDLCGICMRSESHKHHAFAIISTKTQEKFVKRHLVQSNKWRPFLDTEGLTQPPLQALPVVKCSLCSLASVYICLFCWPLTGYCENCFLSFSPNHIDNDHFFGVANTPGNMQLISWVLASYQSQPVYRPRSLQ